MPTSADINNYYIGKGTLSWTPEGGVLRDLGNVPEFELTPDLEKLAHFSSRAGIRKKDREVVISQSVALRLILEEWTIDNLQMALMGGTITTNTFDIFAVSELRGQINFIGTNDVGPQIDIVLPLVSFTPSGSINPLSDDWAGLELTGEVLSVGGVFGTLTHRDVVV
tara:strand:+ start:1098 stop:1598 length:501 start_codon:yes stop_codon:yes gene_type:complete